MDRDFDQTNETVWGRGWLSPTRLASLWLGCQPAILLVCGVHAPSKKKMVASVAGDVEDNLWEQEVEREKKTMILE